METDPLIALEQAAREAKAAQAERRSHCIRIYLTAAEAQDVLAACQSLPASIYCRAKVLGQSVPRPRRQIPALNRQYYTELARVSRNLNQLTKGVNQAVTTGQALPLTETDLECLQALKETLNRHYLAVMKLTIDPEIDPEIDAEIDTETTEKGSVQQESQNAHQTLHDGANDANR